MSLLALGLLHFSTQLVVTRVFPLQLLVIPHLLYLSSVYLHCMCFGVYGA